MLGRVPSWTWAALLVPAIAVIITGIVLPSVSGNGKARAEKPAKAAPAVATPSGEGITWVTLRGLDECSDIVDLDAGPSGENFFGLYPSGTMIRFLDHNDLTILIDDLPDSPIAASGNVCFLGPAGGRVRVRQVPN